MTQEAIIQMAIAVLTYGPSAIIKLAEALKNKDNITANEIRDLFITDNPEDYFNR